MAKIFMGVVHLAALPSAASFDGDLDAVFEAGLRDARALADGGVDAIMVENFGDQPFHKGSASDPVSPDVPAILAILARDIRQTTGLPVGINCLRNDGIAALAAARASGASWVRINVLSGSYVTDQGLIEGEGQAVLAYRRQIACEAEILADHMVKHAAPLAAIDPLTSALDLAERGGADALILTGSRTGEPVDREFLAALRAKLGEFPIWVGSGVDPDMVAEIWPLCQGIIVGSALKAGGVAAGAVERARVEAMRQALSRC
jgi:membrane complex biogenesis BtpA family protein